MGGANAPAISWSLGTLTQVYKPIDSEDIVRPIQGFFGADLDRSIYPSSIQTGTPVMHTRLPGSSPAPWPVEGRLTTTSTIWGIHAGTSC